MSYPTSFPTPFCHHKKPVRFYVLQGFDPLIYLVRPSIGSFTTSNNIPLSLNVSNHHSLFGLHLNSWLQTCTVSTGGQAQVGSRPSGVIFMGISDQNFDTQSLTISLHCCSPNPYRPVITSSVYFSLSQLTDMKRDASSWGFQADNIPSQ